MTRAALYVRVSSRKQGEKYSLPTQRKILTEHAQRQGWTPTLYDEGAVSAETLSARPVMQRLLRDVAAGELDVVLVIEIERLCRASDLTDWATITTTMRRAEVRVATPERIFDLSSAEDDFEADLRGVLSKREKRKLLERCARGRKAARDAGRWLGGRAPWGYRFNKESRTLEVIPARAKIVQEVFASDIGAATLHARYRARGVVIPEYTLHRMRRNLTYAGKLRDSAGRVIDGDWPAIVTYETWLAAQPGLDARRTGRAAEAKYMLAGVLTCAGCGRRITSLKTGGSPSWPTKGERTPAYACRTYRRKLGVCTSPGVVAQWAVDTLVLDAWRRHVAAPAAIRAGFDALAARLSDDREGGRYADIQEAIRALEVRKARVLDALEAGAVTPADVATRLARLDQERGALAAEASALFAERSRGALPPWETVLAMLRSFPRAPAPARRAVLLAFLERAEIDFGERRLALTWRFGGETARYAIPNVRQLVNRASGSAEARKRLLATAGEYRRSE